MLVPPGAAPAAVAGAAPSTQSGWARTRSESRLTISGSTQSPNSMPEPADVVDQRAQPVAARRPRRRTSRRARRVSSRRCRNQPSSSTNRSTPTAAAASASARQPVEVVVEVDRLPGVEHHRPRACAGGCGRARSCRWKPAEQPVQPGAGPGEQHTACAYVSPGASRTSPGSSSSPPPSTPACPPAPSGSRSAQVTVVAAPGDVHAPDLAVSGSRSRACPATSSRVASWPVRPRRTRAGPACPWPSRWRCGRALAAPAPGEVEQLARPGRHRQQRRAARRARTASAPVLVSTCRIRSSPPGVQLELGAQRSPASGSAARVEHHAPPSSPRVGGRRRPAAGGRPGRRGEPASPGRPGPAARRRRQQRERPPARRAPLRGDGRHRRGRQFGRELAPSSAPRSAPQCSTRGSPGPRRVEQRALRRPPAVHRRRRRRRSSLGGARASGRATNCFCSTKKTTSVGSATMTEPAASRLLSVKNWPRRLFSALVIGHLSPVLHQHDAQKKSL